MFEQDTVLETEISAKKQRSVLFVNDENATWDEIMELREYLLKVASETSESDEIEYRTKDPVRKFQIDYDKSLCLSEKFPEAFLLENQQPHVSDVSVAPGEGKIPENILMSENWDETSI